MLKYFPLLASVFAILGVAVYSNIKPINNFSNELISPEVVEKINTLDGQVDYAATTGIWENKGIDYKNEYFTVFQTRPLALVLGITSGEKWIEINLSNQRLYAHEGDSVVMEFPISSGTKWTPTVTGQFHIWAKVFSQRMSGGESGTSSYYSLPNVPYVQYFYKGYGIHGAYWHNDFGKPRSHGCVNMRPDDAKTLYYWTNPPIPDGKRFLGGIKPEESTRVVVHGTTP